MLIGKFDDKIGQKRDSFNHEKEGVNFLYLSINVEPFEESFVWISINFTYKIGFGKEEYSIKQELQWVIKVFRSDAGHDKSGHSKEGFSILVNV